MNSSEAVIALIESLNQTGIKYMVSGSFATNLYAPPRSTQDADVVVHASAEELQTLFRNMPEEFRLEPQMKFETIRFTTRHEIRVKGTQFKIELYLLTDDAFDQERFRRRVRGIVEGLAADVATAEDVIVQKLRWARSRQKDRADALNVLREQGDALDWPYIESWCDRHGTRDLLEQLREEVRPAPP